MKILFLSIFFLFSLRIFSQTEVAYCDFKGITEKMGKVVPKNTIEELDKLFGAKAKIAEKKGKGDSVSILYKYQFCDSNIKNTIFVSFYCGKMRYILKGFKNGKCYGKKNSCILGLKKDWTYEEVKEKHGVEGDLKGIYWDAEGKETAKEFQWYCCDSKEYAIIVFVDGKYRSSSHFPKSDPMNGRPYSHPKGRR